MRKRILSGLFLILAIITLFFGYRHFSKEIPISYYDEEWWIGDSYFYQFYTEGNFNRNIWDSNSSKDQPMLTRYVFGAWLYHEYIEAKKYDKSLDYSKFLTSRGFLGPGILSQHSPKNDLVTLPVGISGLPDDLVKDLGGGILTNIQIIQKVRGLALLLLIIAVVVPTLLIKNVKGLLFASVFLFFYGFNTLIVNSGLMAQTESIFLLFFNSSLVFMYIFYSNIKKLRYLFIFSVLAGLCFSTKLNGIMLLFAFIALETEILIFHERNTNIIKSISNVAASAFITLSVFTVLNPFVYPNPIGRILEMFNHRQGVVNIQMKIFPEDAINRTGDQYLYIAKSFFDNEHILEFNNIKFNSIIDFLGPLLFALFVLGMYLEIKKARKGDKFADFMLIAFIVVGLTTGAYLQLSWNRYLVHLVIFFVYYQVVGLYFIVTKIKRRFYSSTNEAGFTFIPAKSNDSTACLPLLKYVKISSSS
jgi:hypothetical protein